MSREYQCTKCKKKFKTMVEYLAPNKHPCVVKSDKVPPPEKP